MTGTHQYMCSLGILHVLNALNRVGAMSLNVLQADAKHEMGGMFVVSLTKVIDTQQAISSNTQKHVGGMRLLLPLMLLMMWIVLVIF